MKNKPGSHKSQNTFKFKSFSERIASVNIDVVHRIGSHASNPKEADTFFYETLTKWCELNCSQSFEDFKKELRSDIVTLNQLVLREKEIIALIQKHLKIEGSLALQPLLELIVAIARDLLSDFYVHFPEVFETVVSLVSTQDVERLEWVFTCLAYLFKFLWRYMKDIENVFRLYLPLLHDRKSQHLRLFAAESFGFLLRKVSDKERLLDFIFLQLDGNPWYVEGIGQLLFEMLKGVQNQLHSVSEKHLPLLFAKLGTGLTSSQDLAFDSVLEAQLWMAKSAAVHLQKKFTVNLWITLLGVLKKLAAAADDPSKSKENVQVHLHRFLKILEVFVSHRDGMLIAQPEELLEALTHVLGAGNFGDDCGSLLFRLISCVICCQSHELGMIKLFRNAVSAVFESSYGHRAVFQFVREMLTYRMFEKDVLPCLLGYCERLILRDEEFKSDVLAVLVNMLQKLHPFPRNGDELLAWKPFKLDVGKSDNTGMLERFIVATVESAVQAEDVNYFTLENSSSLWASVYLVPYIRFRNSEFDKASFQKLFAKLALVLEKELHPQNIHEIFYLVTSILLISDRSSEIFETVSPSVTETVLRSCSESGTILLTVATIMKFAAHFSDERFDTTECWANTFNCVGKNLSSPCHELRLATLEILASFTYDLPASDREVDKNARSANVFEICLEAEKISPNIATYREKLKYLQKLDFLHVHNYLPVMNPSKEFQNVMPEISLIPLQYLLGAMYANFSLMWGPILDLIESQAKGLPVDLFWSVFLPRLQQVVHSIEHRKVTEPDVTVVESDADLTKVFLNSFVDDKKMENSNPDHENHRHLLWKVMAEFAGMIESKNRDISSLFLQFIEKEFYRSDTGSAPTQDISKDRELGDTVLEETIELEDDDEENDDDDDDEEEANKIADKMDCEESTETNIVVDDDDDDDDDVEEPNTTTPIAKRRKSLQSPAKSKQLAKKKGCTKTLCGHLKVLSKFRNPKAIYRESELRSLYGEFLSHPNSEVQRLAFECLFAYNEKMLVPYKENLRKLLDDKTFKTELTSFNIDVQSQMIQEEHREKVLPFLMRILYGKMLNSTGRNTGGKSNSNLRRGIIVRFLAGTKEQELLVFLGLSFSSFDKLIKDDAVDTVLHVKDVFSVKSIIPLKRIQSSLNLLGIVLDKLGNLMIAHSSWLLKLLLSINTTLAEALEHRDNVASFFVHGLRNLRTKALMLVNKFFIMFDEYAFGAREIDAIFMATVWPQLDRMHFESLHSPTPLLRLFHQWSTNPRFYALFAKHYPGDPKLSPLPQLMDLFVAPKLRVSCSNMILEIVVNLLTLIDGSEMIADEPMDGPDEHRPPPPVDVNDCVPLPDVANFSERPNKGTLLLLEHIPKILTQLKTILHKFTKSSKKPLPERILTILTRLSEYVTGAEQCSDLIPLLFTFLFQNSRRVEGEEINILRTLNNLLRNCTNPQQFVRKIATLFGRLSHRNSRVALCDLLSTIASRDVAASPLAELALKLNAWDSRRVDQPDYDARLDAYCAAIKYIKDDASVDLDYLILAAFNSTFYIGHTDDMSIRNTSSHLLQTLATKLSAYRTDRPDDANVILFTVLLPEIRKNLRSKNEVVLHQFVAIFAKVVAACQTMPRLSSLRILLNDDPEIDFFENIKHTQTHRQARAMTRLARSGCLKDFKEDSIIQYLIPITSFFFFNDSYKKHSNVVDAAIELMSSICKTLTWYHYEGYLKHYLDLLPKLKENQKTGVKIIVAILDAFHFSIGDLFESSSSSVAEDVVVPDEELNNTDKTENNDDGIVNDDVDMMIVEELGDENKPTNEPVTKPDMSKKIFHSIVKGILPKLHRCLTKKTKMEGEHKLVRSSFPEEDEVLRIPIALAMVKLLQKLPKETLEQNLHGLFLKMCVFLKSRMDSIRETTRSTIVKIMVSLGPAYLAFLLKLMAQTMTRGYQVHVMIYTMNTILQGVSTQLKAGDLDSCVTYIVEACNEELFGNIAEEKEVDQIVGKLKEARGNKSYNMYKLTAQFITTESLLPLIKPLKELLATSYKHQMVNKAQECFHNIVMGLIDNSAILSTSLLVFCYGLVNESIPELTQTKGKVRAAKKLIPVHLQVPDSYLILPEPSRKVNSQTSKKTNAHILINFGLELLYFGLKRNKISSTNEENLHMLDPFISCLLQCLAARHIKLVTTSMRCFCGMLKMPLPSLNTNIRQITSSLFLLLNKYAGSSQGENVEMVQVCFKAITFLVRDVEFHNISESELQVLLTYVEHDILDYSRQATAFTLLKVILSRKLVIEELHQLMKKVAEMSISSDINGIRVQCRQVFLQYLLDYPLGKKLNDHFDFYLAQLNFEHQYGRESALLFLTNVVTTFPINLLSKTSGQLFVSISTALVNDDDPHCRKLAHQVLKKLLERLSPVHQDKLFSAVSVWLKDSKLNHKRLAAQLCGLFAEVLGTAFERYLDDLLPVLIEAVNPDDFSDIIHESLEKTTDHVVYLIFNSFTKIIKECQLVKTIKHKESMKKFWEYTHQNLLHEHTWVRLATCQLFGLLFSSYSCDEILQRNDDTTYLLDNAEFKLKTLAQKFMSQFQAPEVNIQLADQIVKNLVYVAKVFWQMQKNAVESALEGEEETEKRVSVDWLVKKMNREATYEVVHNPKTTTKRSAIFKWLAAVAIDLGQEGLTQDCLRLILTHLQRELSDHSAHSDAELKNLANEVVELIQKIVGVEMFSKQFAALQAQTNRKRSERKTKRAQMVIADPQLAARKRIKKQASKTNAKKRRVEKMRPSKASNRNKLQNMAVI